jgi:hypothetical protein
MLGDSMSSEPMTREPPWPWKDFLTELASLLQEAVALHCIGGFVVSVRYGLPRPTGDIDYISVSPLACDPVLNQIAGLGSTLSKKYRLYLQRVTVTSMPENYESRLEEIFSGSFVNLHLFAPDPYDLILSKLERNGPKDRVDVEFLAKNLSLDSNLLRERYTTELRPYLANEDRHDTTIRLWTEAFFQSPNSL